MVTRDGLYKLTTKVLVFITESNYTFPLICFSYCVEKMRISLFISLVCLATFGDIGVKCHRNELKLKHYYKKCRFDVETVVREIVWDKVTQNPSLVPKLLRLHFHDCFVRGCDASILLDSTMANETEKAAISNLSISGYDTIDDVKNKLEEICPGIVSCADIVALAARDAVSYEFKKDMWEVPTGRKDGKISVASEALSDLPSSFANFTTLLNLFKRKGLDLSDLVTLSGAHTIGVSPCGGTVARRLFNFTGKGDTDPSIDANYATILKNRCPLPTNPNSTVEMDPTSSSTFDSHYYKAVRMNMGLFRSDAALLTNQKSARMVRILENHRAFYPMFARSMVKMGAMGVANRDDKEIRKNCRVVN